MEIYARATYFDLQLHGNKALMSSRYDKQAILVFPAELFGR